MVPTASGEGGAATTDDSPAAAPAAAEAEAFRPSTFSFLRSVTLRSEEDERAPEAEAAESVDPAAAEATRRAFDAAVLTQWQRQRGLRVG